MKASITVHHTVLAAALVATSFVAIATGHDEAHSHVKVTQLSRRAITEKVDGKAASATVVEVTFAPGQTDTPHRHAGPVFGYVLEGVYEHAIDDEAVKTYRAGETFYEPSGCLHRVARNPSQQNKTRLLAVILHPREAKEATVREAGE